MRLILIATPLIQILFDIIYEMVPDDARVEGVRGHAAAVEPLAKLLGEEDIGQLE